MSDEEPAALVLLVRHLGQPSPEQPTWTDIKAAVAGLSDDRLDASIRYFGQAGSPATARAAEMLTDVMVARMAPLLGASRSEQS